MAVSNEIVFLTDRLTVRRAAPSDEDVDFLCRLWTDPEVMTFVGFPHGLRITRDEIRLQMDKRGSSVYDTCLIAELNDSNRIIGECRLGRPDNDGISETDVKIVPEFRGRGYGTEIKRGLVDYLFTHTDCRAVKATPNKGNIASQKMQEAVGGRRVGEGIFEFPEDKKEYTRPVPHYVYMVFREDWEKSQN